VSAGACEPAAGAADACPALDADQEEVLREVINVAMGTAGAALATALDRFVQLSVPRIVSVAGGPASGRQFTRGLWRGQSVSAVRQAFYGYLAGEVVAIFDAGGAGGLADLMGYADERGDAAERELLLDVSNVMAGACVNGIAQQLRAEFDYAAPSLLCENQPFDSLVGDQLSRWTFALLVEVDFKLEDRAFTSGLLIFFSRSTFGRLRDAMAALLDGSPLA
jgi:chemotaxis protein CheC